MIYNIEEAQGPLPPYPTLPWNGYKPRVITIYRLLHSLHPEILFPPLLCPPLYTKYIALLYDAIPITIILEQKSIILKCVRHKKPLARCSYAVFMYLKFSLWRKGIEEKTKWPF